MFIHSAQVCGEELKTQPLPAGTVSTTLLLLRQQNQLLLLLRQLPHSSVPEWERTAPLQLRAAERYISELIFLIPCFAAGCRALGVECPSLAELIYNG